ncbi:MAG: hypothetical protein KDB60_02490 [Propionibacteriaceae bacterium]|nr:hypothetical protein [Propionibacteriaceae bacterium]
MDADLQDWCERALGSSPEEVFFRADSMSAVSGVLLADRRRVAVKARTASDRVLACAEAHRRAIAAGIDAPELLAGPDRLAPSTWVTAEAWRPEGTVQPPGDAIAAYAELGCRLVRALDGLEPSRFAPPPPWAWYDHDDPGRVWPPAASQRWDPESPVVPARLRRVAAAAQERLLAATSPSVVGHCDLNGLNVRWAEGPIVHDWDSLAGRPECVLAGILAANHVELPGAGAIADVPRTRALLERYQELRPFSPEEVEVAWAAGTWVAAYNAAFEYLHGTPGRVVVQLDRDGAERLRLAGCG